MSPLAQRGFAVASVVGASLVAWYTLSTALQTFEPIQRGLLLAAPALALALVGFPALAARWWVRILVCGSVWGLAFYAGVRLYYPVGGASGSCAIAGLAGGAALTAVALLSKRDGIARNRWIFLLCGLLWVVGGALIGHGVDLNFDNPMIQRKPGRLFLFAGVVVWHLPFALLRTGRREIPRPGGFW